ncbi:uncharacterized protein LOC128278171 [Anopheles cruzii]|uniref:uncharacterized protein LOC128278171 n=1 Tax=Anopheles cruzii TaxID=68878 RepID=UPI0022EC5B3D|nr:uncharacterized protein LOC128278171 [Anopheles cruzii]
MSTSKPSTDSFSDDIMVRCRKCLSTDGALEPVTFDERGKYLSQQVFSCTNVQLKLLPNIPTYLCSACKAQLNFLDKLRSIWISNNAKIKLVKEEVDTTHLTGSETTVEHSGGGMQQSDAVESVVKTEVATEDSEDYYHHDDLFEAEEVSLETLLKREPMENQQQPQLSHADQIQEEGSLVRNTTTGLDDQSPISGHNNLGIKHAAEGTAVGIPPKKNSRHTGNQPISVVGEQRLLRSNKRRSSQKDIVAAECSMSTMQSPQVTH